LGLLGSGCGREHTPFLIRINRCEAVGSLSEGTVKGAVLIRLKRGEGIFA
jgi:hypothetical protein